MAQNCSNSWARSMSYWCRSVGIAEPTQTWQYEQIGEGANDNLDAKANSLRAQLAADLNDLTQNILLKFDKHLSVIHKHVALERERLHKSSDFLRMQHVERTSRRDGDSGVGERTGALLMQMDTEAASRPCPILTAEAVHQAEAEGLAQADGFELHMVHTLSSNGNTKDYSLNGKCIFSASHPLLLFFNLTISITIIVGLWGDSLSMVSDWDEHGYGPLGLAAEITMVLLFALDVLINFNTSVESDQGVFVFDRCAIAKQYLKSWFIIDFVSTVPWGWMLSSLGSSRSLKLMKMVKLSRMAKIAKLGQNERLRHFASDLLDTLLATSHMNDVSISHIMSYARLFMGMSKFVCLLAIEAHLISCVMLANSEGGRLVWQYGGLDASALHPWMRYFLALRWGAGAVVAGFDSEAVQMSTTQTDPHVFRLILTFCHACNVLIALSIFSNTKGSEDADAAFRLEALNVYLRRHETVPNRTRRNVMHYLCKQQQRLFGSKIIPGMISELSHDMRRQLFANMFGHVLRQCHVFMQGSFVDTKRSKTDLVDELVSVLQTGYHLADDFLIRQGSHYEGMLCLVTGRLIRRQRRAERESTYPVEADERFFGLESLFAPLEGTWQKSVYNIVTVSVAETTCLTRVDFDATVTSHRSWSFFAQFIRSKVQSGEVDAGFLYGGIAAKLLKEFEHAYNATDTRVASEELGVCCEYIMLQFAHDISTEVSEFSLEEVEHISFSKLKRRFWPKDRKAEGFLGSAQHICPRDGLEGSSIVDTLPDDSKGMATHFVSWCWSYTVLAVASALSHWVREHNRDPTKDFLWMCFFCNNQRKLMSGGTSENLVETFGVRLEKIGHMIILLNTHHNPQYTTRAWCIFESYTATERNIPIDMALPTESKKELWKQIKDGNFQEMVESLTSIDAESAKASRAEDEVHIKTLIRNTIGFTAVNETVKQALTNWLVANFEECLTESSVSDVAHFIFCLIKESSAYVCRRNRKSTRSITSVVLGRTDMKSSTSGSSFRKNELTQRVSMQFNVAEWRAFATDHPAVLDFLELDAEQITATFLTFRPNADGDVHIKSLDRFLKDRHKSNMNEFLLWLGTMTEKPDYVEDEALESILQGGLLSLQRKVETIKEDLKSHQTVSEELAHCIGRPWSVEAILPEPPSEPFGSFWLHL